MGAGGTRVYGLVNGAVVNDSESGAKWKWMTGTSDLPGGGGLASDGRR